MPQAESLSAQSDGVIQPYGDSPLDEEALAETVYLNIINQAQRYVYIYTPYFAVGETMLEALKAAAKRGVDVRLILPGIPDKKLCREVQLADCRTSLAGTLLDSVLRLLSPLM